MLRNNGPPGRQRERSELTEEQARWVAERWETAGHWKWLWRSLKRIGIIAGAIIGTATATIVLISQFKDLLKWMGTGKW